MGFGEDEFEIDVVVIVDGEVINVEEEAGVRRNSCDVLPVLMEGDNKSCLVLQESSSLVDWSLGLFRLKQGVVSFSKSNSLFLDNCDKLVQTVDLVALGDFRLANVAGSIEDVRVVSI